MALFLALFLSVFSGRPLTVTLSCGVRTFLPFPLQGIGNRRLSGLLRPLFYREYGDSAKSLSGIVAPGYRTHDETINQKGRAIPETLVPRAIRKALRADLDRLGQGCFDVFPQGSGKIGIPDDDIGLMIQKQGQTIAIAGTDCCPYIIDDGNFPVKLGLVVLKHLDSAFQQLRVKRLCNRILNPELATTDQENDLDPA